jgi:hypothetical protein
MFNQIVGIFLQTKIGFNSIAGKKKTLGLEELTEEGVYVLLFLYYII